MRPQFSWIFDFFLNNSRRIILLRIAIFLLVLSPVALIGYGGYAFATHGTSLDQFVVVSVIAIAIVIFISVTLSSLIVALNLFRQKEEIYLANAGDALVVIDRSWNIELWNKTAEILTGWSADEVVGKPFRDIVKFIREGDQTENVEFIEEAMVYGRVGTLEDHTVLIRKDGLQLPIGDSAAPLFDPQGTVIGAIIVFRDKSREHDLEEAREEFISLASRELHEPLAAVKDYIGRMLGALSLSSGDIAAREYSEVIQQANERILTLVNTLLNVLNIEQGKLDILPEPVHLPELADAIIKECVPEIKTKNIAVECAYEAGIPSLNLDIPLTRAVLQNFLSNAIKYTPEHGTISVRIKKDNGGIVCSVSDTGYGIPKHQQAKVFSKLFRADNVKDKGVKGTGLGLYMVKLIVEEAGGKIWFESEEGKGSTFHLSIPLEGMRKREGKASLN